MEPINKPFNKDVAFDWASQVEKYRGLLPRYKAYAETLQKVLKKASNKYAPNALVQSREKVVSSFAEKILRKSYLYHDPVNDLTDLCGARVITHTIDEVKAMCEFIEKNFEIDWDNSVDITQRLKPAEFGYRSVHYVVQFKHGVFPGKEVDIKIPEDLFPGKECPMKAEIQVRTILEHSWADFMHDRGYKGAFKIPQKWERDIAGLAAMLEEADKAFSRIDSGLKEYASNYGSYITEERARGEIKMLEFVLDSDPGNVQVAHKIGKLAMTIGDWDKAAGILSKYVKSNYAPILRDLGISVCKKNKSNPKSEVYRQGREYLEKAISLQNKDVDALASLAGTWKGIDDKKAKEYYRQAFEIDPCDPYPLCNYLEYYIIDRKDTSQILLMSPLINHAIQRCKNQIEVGMNIPWAFYCMGKFYLLVGKPYDSLNYYAKAVQSSPKDWMVETSLKSLNKLAPVGDKIEGYEWIRRFLIIGLANFGNPDAVAQLKKMRSSDYGDIQGPVIIVAGGCDPSVEKEMLEYKNMLVEAFNDFRGTVISGGTKSGVSGLVGSVQNEYPDNIKTISYLPKKLPEGTSLDKRYREIRYIKGDDFTPLEPLQNWIDIISSGIKPSQVNLIGINGGRIAAAEYNIAMALGAKVAVIEGSGREAAKLSKSDELKTPEMFLKLPSDAMILRAFIGSEIPELDKKIREIIAKGIHENYRRVKSESGSCEDKSMADWDKLENNLKESNFQQADHILEKLRHIGCNVYKVKGRAVAQMPLKEREVELMAEMEHARWMIERLLDGWKLGEKKDIDKKISPYLKPWSELPENIKKLDTDPVRKIPEFLAKVRIEVIRQYETK